MNFLILGRGKTGSLVADLARQRRHQIQIVGSKENLDGSALTPAKLREVDVVIDFTTPNAVIENIQACVRAGKNMVLYAANFSIGVNLFFEIARTAATAMRYGYHGQIFERHHAQKKDAPSGTAVAIQRIIHKACSEELEIISFREGEVVGMHEVMLDSLNDTIYLCHDAKSRRGFAEGAVMAAEWLSGKRGFFDFKDIWQEL